MTFYVGQKVVCVDDDWGDGAFNSKPPLNGLPVAKQVYTVSGTDEGFLLNLFECGTHWFHPSHFRPAVSPKPSIKVFEEILDRTVKGEPVEA